MCVKSTYLLVLLIKVIYVSVQDLDEKLDRHCGVHASICYPQSPLQALKHALAVSV